MATYKVPILGGDALNTGDLLRWNGSAWDTTTTPETARLTLTDVCSSADGANFLRVTGLQVDGTAMTGTLRGAYIDVSNGSTAATGTIRAMELKARTEAPEDTGNDVNVLEGLSISADSKGHSVTTMRAAEFILDGTTGGTITEAVGLRIANNLQANKATTSYGLQIYRDSFDYTADIQLSSGGLIGGSGGHIKIDSGGNTTLTSNFIFPETTATTGIIYKDEELFIHNFKHPTGGSVVPIGHNLFVGKSAGNLTMGSTAIQDHEGGQNIGFGDSTLSSVTSGYRNTAIGYYALHGCTTGKSNVAFGPYVMRYNTTGYNNNGIGYFSLYNLCPTSGAITAFADSSTSPGTKITVTSESHDQVDTTIVQITGTINYNGSYEISNSTENTFDIVKVFTDDDAAGWWGIATESRDNTANGNSTGYYLTTGSNNTFFGAYSGYYLTTGSNNIFLGKHSAYRQTTNSNLFIVDNQARANVATELTNAILYGVMAAAPADQTLRVNAGLKISQAAYWVAQQTATGDGTTTIDWGLGNKFYFTFGAANETFTFTAPGGPCNLILVLKQDGTGSRTATWPATVMWPGGTAPTLSTGAAAVDLISFYYDGTNYFGNSALDYSVPA